MANVLDVKIEQAGYEQGQTAISNINFNINKGELIGIIGPNGAGKSTSIKAILGTLEFLKGSVKFQDSSMRYAYIPEQPLFYEELTLWEHIRFTASVCQLSEEEMNQRVKPLLETFRLDDVIHQFPSTFSKGMQQKLMIVLAFLTSPDLYIIDEPFIGLDPKAMNDFLRHLNLERVKGASVLMSTHMLETAERICDRYLLIMNGEILAQGTIGDIRKEAHLKDGSLLETFEKLMEHSS